MLATIKYFCWSFIDLMGKERAHLTHALCTSTNSLSVQGHISLPYAQRPAKWFCHGNVSGLPASGILHKLKRCAALRRCVFKSVEYGCGRLCAKQQKWQGRQQKKNRPLAMQTTRFSRQITDVLIWPCICTNILEKYCFSSSYSQFLST